jgi:hypothetical protein
VDKKTEKHILNVLRQGTVTWQGRSLCLKAVRKRFKTGTYKNGKDKLVYHYQCNTCKAWFRDFEVEVDHIEEIGSFNGDFDEYIRRMYCGQDNLQVLCVPCHRLKSSHNSCKRNEWKRKNG